MTWNQEMSNFDRKEVLETILCGFSFAPKGKSCRIEDLFLSPLGAPSCPQEGITMRTRNFITREVRLQQLEESEDYRYLVQAREHAEKTEIELLARAEVSHV